ncbi:hypothetical protein EIN_226610 [Entamoeba invadens IP1]|uniref:F-box domain-containing protein n=1 Tax=Entamoeba invadens IP1 TaxID=370355 RepID=A0A0A1U8G9_ENTIV|nr:hypothetical protein EIN_226610 [Entamoeba invadens IP1]ELP88278.1 hypothetical protein EIN_226610 [Entamoeba invadens IP1]|eukprot:XP_004255049.1 hypothetical protein EIN_226610 [Entamoeba invadens IP1]
MINWEIVDAPTHSSFLHTQSYLKRTENSIKTRSVCLLPHTADRVSSIFYDTPKLISLFPNVSDFCAEPDGSFCINFFITSINQVFSTRFKSQSFQFSPLEGITIHNETSILIEHNYYFRQDENTTNTLVIIETVFPNQYKVHKVLMHHSLNACEEAINNLFFLLENNQSVIQINEIKRELIRKCVHKDYLTNILHKSPSFTAYTTKSINEVMIIGCGNFCDFKQAMSALPKLVVNEPFFTSSILVQQEDSVLGPKWFHKESVFFGEIPSVVDVKYSGLISERNMFFCCASGVRRKNCVEAHNPGCAFSYVLGAEWVESVGQKAVSVYCFHFFIPKLESQEHQLRKLVLTHILDRVILTRYVIESCGIVKVNEIFVNNKQLPKTQHSPREFLFDLSQKILQNNMLLKKNVNRMRTLLKEKRRHVATKGRSGDFNLFALPEKILHKILTFLPLEDLVVLLAVSKRMHLYVMNSLDLWQTFYDLYFNALTFKKFNLITPLTHPEPCDYHYLVKTSKMLQFNWKNQISLKKSRIVLFDKSPVDYIKPTPCGMSIMGSSCGKCCQVAHPTNLKTREVLVGDKIVSLELYTEMDKSLMFMLLNSGAIRVYVVGSDDYSTITTDKFEYACSIPQHQFCYWDKSGTVSLCDLDTGKCKFKFQTGSQEQLHVDEMAPDLLVLSSTDKCLKGFDLRSNRVVFNNSTFGGYITTFDGFDNYIVCGGTDGILTMLDMRTNQLCLDRCIHQSAINVVKCWNRKILTGGEDKGLCYFDCSQGWFGNYRTLYRHQDEVTSIVFDDQILMTGSRDGILYYTDFSVFN